MTSLHAVADGVAYDDLEHLGRREAIAVYLFESSAGLTVVDPGPSSTAAKLRDAITNFGATPADVGNILLTHIHLDHAGIVGSLARENPKLRVHVHERGATHLVDPTRLLESARRIYKDEMEPLWGEFLAVPREQLIVLQGGERLTIGERKLRVAYTPGHAWHHVAYLDEGNGFAFVGDVAGEASQHGTPALPASRPPDIDLESWKPSLDLIAAWGPEALLLTHYGPVRHVVAHLDSLWERIIAWSLAVRASLGGEGSDDTHADAFVEAEMARLTATLTAEQIVYVDRDSIRGSWFGLARYWRKKGTAVSG
ncbi:MAG: MBL fold metallo-hydrolase [Gemmatimonadaceae bacterium]